MKRASYTVEAALLMGILIPLLVGVIYVGFYLKTRGEVYGSALEKVLTAVLSGEKADGVELGEEKVSASAEKTVPLLPFGKQFFHLSDQVKGSCTLERQKPARTVFQLHSLKKMVRQVRDP